MRIEISVPGIRKDRGKLPTPTILRPLTLARSPAADLPIRGQLIDAAPQGLAIGAPVSRAGRHRAPGQPQDGGEDDGGTANQWYCRIDKMRPL